MTIYSTELQAKLSPYYNISPNLELLNSQQAIDEFFMNICIELTLISRQLDEVPVAALVVKDHKIIGIGINCTILHHDTSAHAEIMAIRDAGQNLQNYRLVGSTIYVTLEPCPMCSGAIMHARCQRIVYGTSDEKTGALGSRFNLFTDYPMNHFPQITSGIATKTTQTIISDYFKSKRKPPKNS